MRTISAFTSTFTFLPSISVLLASVLISFAAGAQTTSVAKPSGASSSAVSGSPASQVSLPSIEGKTLDGKAFKLSMLKGKVALVMFWSTECAVCRDKMPELRENYKGWAGKPFELVMVSVDRRMKDVDDYEAIINRMVPMQQRFVQMWIGEAGYKDNLGSAQLLRTQLPAAFLVDKTGKIVERYNGRIPPEVWDVIADLL